MYLTMSLVSELALLASERESGGLPPMPLRDALRVAKHALNRAERGSLRSHGVSVLSLDALLETLNVRADTEL